MGAASGGVGKINQKRRQMEMASSQSYKLSRTIKRPAAQVFYALTHEYATRQWLCDGAWMQQRADGRFFFNWRNGGTATGAFTAWEENKRVELAWHADSCPAPTRIEINLAETGGETALSLTHDGFGTGPEWEACQTSARKLWEEALENLQAVVETGFDLRITRRPMLGIVPTDMTDDDAKRLGVPVTKGIYLQETIDGMGSAAAGLTKDDVIVLAEGKPITNFDSLATIMQTKRAGEILKVEFYRGQDKRTAEITLSGRQWPTIPDDPRDMAKSVRTIYDRIEARIDELIAGLDDEMAAVRPSAEEWSVKEILAHLILTERDDQHFVASVVGGDQLQGGGQNLASRIGAVIESYNTVDALRQELSRSLQETVAFLAALPADFVQHKVGYHMIGLTYLEGLEIHFRLHAQQLEAAIPVKAS
jgi:uncharacterized protein YndB with AHSA1/START domain